MERQHGIVCRGFVQFVFTKAVPSQDFLGGGSSQKRSLSQDFGGASPQAPTCIRSDALGVFQLPSQVFLTLKKPSTVEKWSMESSLYSMMCNQPSEAVCMPLIPTQLLTSKFRLALTLSMIEKWKTKFDNSAANDIEELFSTVEVIFDGEKVWYLCSQ